MDLDEVKLLAAYKKAASKIRYAKTIEDYWVAPYDFVNGLDNNCDNDNNDFDRLSIYVKKLERYVPILEKAVNLRQQHYLLYIKDKKVEDLGHKFWRLELLKIVEDAKQKLTYYQQLLDEKFNQLMNFSDLRIPDFYTPYTPNLLIENVDEDEVGWETIAPPEISNNERQKRKKLRQKQRKANQREENRLLRKLLIYAKYGDKDGNKFISLETTIKKKRALSPWLIVIPDKIKGMDLTVLPETLENIFCRALSNETDQLIILNIALLGGRYHGEIYQLCIKYLKKNYKVFDIVPMINFEYIIKIMKPTSNFELIFNYMDLFNSKILLLCISAINAMRISDIDPSLFLPHILQEMKAREFEYIKEFNDGFNKYCSASNKIKARVKALADACRKSFTYIIEYVMIISDKIINKESIENRLSMMTPFTQYVIKNNVVVH